MTNYIKRFYDKEEWKQIKLASPFKERYEMYVSNYGLMQRVLLSTGEKNTLKQPLTEGYPTSNLNVILPMSEEDLVYFTEIRLELHTLKKRISEINKLLLTEKKKRALTAELVKTEKLLKTQTAQYKRIYKKKELKRRYTFGGLVHRFVAMKFVEKPSEQHSFVAHMDFDKLNNHHSNLKWMTKEEITKHNLKNPSVIKSKAKVLNGPVRRSNTKLLERDVMIIKKRINEGVSLSQLAKRYEVTETQLLRIKRGINWGKVPAAL